MQPAGRRDNGEDLWDVLMDSHRRRRHCFTDASGAFSFSAIPTLPRLKRGKPIIVSSSLGRHVSVAFLNESAPRGAGHDRCNHTTLNCHQYYSTLTPVLAPRSSGGSYIGNNYFLASGNKEKQRRQKPRKGGKSNSLFQPYKRELAIGLCCVGQEPPESFFSFVIYMTVYDERALTQLAGMRRDLRRRFLFHRRVQDIKQHG